MSECNISAVLSLAVKAAALQMENHISCWHMCVCVCTVHVCVQCMYETEKDANRWWDKGVINYKDDSETTLWIKKDQHFYFY